MTSLIYVNNYYFNVTTLWCLRGHGITGWNAQNSRKTKMHWGKCRCSERNKNDNLNEWKGMFMILSKTENKNATVTYVEGGSCEFGTPIFSPYGLSKCVAVVNVVCHMTAMSWQKHRPSWRYFSRWEVKHEKWVLAKNFLYNIAIFFMH